MGLPGVLSDIVCRNIVLNRWCLTFFQFVDHHLSLICLRTDCLTFRWFHWISFYISILLHIGVIGFRNMCAKQVFRLAIKVMFGLLLLTPITSLSPKKVVVLALTANPATIREVELILRLRIRHLLFLIGKAQGTLLSFNLDTTYLIDRRYLILRTFFTCFNTLRYARTRLFRGIFF